MERNWWEKFLDSLARPGGAVFVLLLILAIFVPAMATMMIRFGPGAPVVITMVTLTSSFAGALGAILVPNSGSSRRSSDTQPTPQNVAPNGNGH